MLIVAGGRHAGRAIVALRLCKELARARCVGLTPLTTSPEWGYAYASPAPQSAADVQRLMA